jgi:hypothetical protein
MLEQLWSTPFLHTTMSKDMQEKVTNKVLTNYDINIPPSDFGVLNILDDIPDFKEKVVYPAFNEFLDLSLDKKIEDWDSHKLHGWITGSVNGYNIEFHNHRGSQLSAVFYILCEEDNKGGEITFADPRMNSNRGYDDSFAEWFKGMSFKPKSGDIVVFPSFLYHFVSTYYGSIRLAMPVDLFLHTNK